jgi:hypothetical protein
MQSTPDRQSKDQRLHRHEGFAKSSAAMGAMHWVKLAGILAPLVIGELVKDPEKKWRYIHLVSVRTAIVSQEMWGNQIKRERDDCREERQYDGRG